MRTRLAVSCTVAIAAMVGLAVVTPDGVERWYASSVGPAIARGVGLPGTLLPISLAEWLELGALTVALTWLVAVGRALWRAAEPAEVVVRRAVVTAWAAVAPVIVLFYVVWGLAYARPAAVERLGWARAGDPPPEVDAAELARLATDLVDEVNVLYLELHRWPDGLAPSEPGRSWDEVDRDIDVGWSRVVEAYGLEPAAARPRGPTKRLLSSGLFTWLGIGGFYFPFTAEANVNAWTPAWQMPHTIAHEKAHQRFVASEDEANFFGFLACVHADDPFVRYAGWLFAQRQVLMALERADPLTFTHVIRGRLPGVQRDVNHARRFWARFDGPLEQLGDAVNDTYLRANRVRGGIRSYSRSLELVIEWSRRRGPDGT